MKSECWFDPARERQPLFYHFGFPSVLTCFPKRSETVWGNLFSLWSSSCRMVRYPPRLRLQARSPLLHDLHFNAAWSFQIAVVRARDRISAIRIQGWPQYQACGWRFDPTNAA
jgi:hypothetical protein